MHLLLLLALTATAAADWALPGGLLDDPLYGAPENDFGCRSDRNPVVVLHGLSFNRDYNFNRLAWNLTDEGYCTFSVTYGAHTLAPWIGGLTAMRESSVEVADFIREVHEKTGSKVDVVGYSEGAVMAVYTPMAAGIADIVDHVVAVGPAINGARYYGLADLWYIGGDVTRELIGLALETLGCPACDDMAKDGNIYNDFQNAERIALPGNKVSIIMSNYDTLVAPEFSRVDEPAVRNIIIQDTCPDDKVNHVGLASDSTVWNMVINELEETDRSFVCGKGLPL